MTWQIPGKSGSRSPISSLPGDSLIYLQIVEFFFPSSSSAARNCVRIIRYVVTVDRIYTKNILQLILKI